MPVMRVLHLAGEYPPRRIGGISTFLENLATSQAREAEVGVLVVRAEQYANDPARNGEDHRVRVGTIDIDFDALSGPVLTGAALQALVPQHPMLSETWDVLHMHDWYGTLPALVGSTRGAPAVMMSAHLPLRFGFTYANHAVPLRARVRLEALGTRLAARVVAVSRHVADLLARRQRWDRPLDELPSVVGTALQCGGSVLAAEAADLHGRAYDNRLELRASKARTRGRGSVLAVWPCRRRTRARRRVTSIPNGRNVRLQA